MTAPRQLITLTRDGEYLYITEQDKNNPGKTSTIRIHGDLELDFIDNLNAIAWNDTIRELVIDSDVT